MPGREVLGHGDLRGLLDPRVLAVERRVRGSLDERNRDVAHRCALAHVKGHRLAHDQLLAIGIERDARRHHDRRVATARAGLQADRQAADDPDSVQQPVVASVLRPLVGLLLREVVGREQLAREEAIPGQRAVPTVGVVDALQPLKDLAQAYAGVRRQVGSRQERLGEKPEQLHERDAGIVVRGLRPIRREGRHPGRQVATELLPASIRQLRHGLLSHRALDSDASTIRRGPGRQADGPCVRSPPSSSRHKHRVRIGRSSPKAAVVCRSSARRIVGTIQGPAPTRRGSVTLEI